LGFPTLKYRRLRGDMIEVFKITKHTDLPNPNADLNPNSNLAVNRHET